MTTFRYWDSQAPALGSNSDSLLLGTGFRHVSTIMVTAMEPEEQVSKEVGHL